MLRGRADEQAAVAALLDGVRDGRGGALVVHGLPGVGKSALLADAAAGAGDMTVLSARGVESESPLPFAALHRLLRPVVGCADRLPGPQARALRAAFGEAPGGGGDRFLAFLGALGVLTEAAERRPVLAVVDDAHWLDEASAAALLFAARRLQVERVGLLFGVRDGDVATFDGEDLPAVAVGGIGTAAAGELLDERAGVPVPPEVRDALVASTGGNPLALVELSGALTADQLAGRAPLPAPLPLTGGVERAFGDRYRRLPPAAQTVLLVAAADDSGRLATIRSAARALGAEEEGLEGAERSGLLRVRGAAVELRHPLVRSAVYGAATSSQRRRVHGALAAALTAAEDADRRAWHRAAAVEEADQEVVAELDRAAGRASARGGHEAASAAWERAAELSAAEESRAVMLYRAASAAWVGARPLRARTLASAGLGLTTDPALRADLRRLLAHLEFHGGSLDTGHRMLLEAAAEVAPHDSRRAAELAMLGAALGAFGARSGTPVDPAALVPVAGPEAPVRDRCLADLVHGLDAVSRAEWGRATPFLRDAVRLAGRLSDTADEDLLLNIGVATWPLGDDEAGLRLQDRLLAAARDRDALVMVVHALTRRGATELATGRWSAAAAGATESLALAESSGQPVLAAWPAAALAVLAALRGDGEAVEGHLAVADRIAAAHSLGIATDIVLDLGRWARGLQAADASGQLHHLSRVSSLVVRHLSALDRVEAAVRDGQPDTARGWVADVTAYAEGTGAAWAAAAAEHGRALLAGGDAAEEHFRRALAAAERSPRVPDRARTHLAYGAFLRRSRRRVDARAHLRTALQLSEDLGARPWAERARQELRASGETARRRTATGAPAAGLPAGGVPAAKALTAQELQVARLVRQGMANRDVAAQLFLSPRTVDFHLRNVFAKLGVASRTELAAQPLD
ncbi:AAA family ATPase [Modestobacter sp. URMC 112]